MLRPVALIAVVAALHGCATQEYCSEQQFFKPTVVSGTPVPNRYFPHVAELELQDDVTLRVFICNKPGGRSLCVEIYPDKDVAFRLVDSKVAISTTRGDSPQVLHFKQVTYKVACHGPTLAEKDARCQSSNESPLLEGAAIEKQRQRTEKIGANFHYVNAYAFSPDAVFKGANVSVALRKFRRKYEAVTETFDPPTDDEVLVELPRVQANGRTLDVPRVAFRFVKEAACRPNRPLSLQ